MDEKRKAHVKASMKYNAANVKQVKLNLNKKTDADIIKALAECGNMQGYIKDLIRKDLNDVVQPHALKLKIIEGEFKDGESVTVSIDGKEFKRKVYYSNRWNDLVIIVYGNEYRRSEFR
ncbi:hypothetical protein [uncultured Methanobrevibacter sp.]|uniref:hypothetical protein n=1 Tax=uncultured Methanobrevibacter sp. TaxID=253161 RepID=UPI00261587E2|nr:hypothetical protein [uncultured Methanobrevibacter sp.]